MVASSVDINLSRWMVFRWLFCKTRVTVFPSVSSLSVSAPCLSCLFLLSALCSRCNLLPVCTNPARISRFGWGLEMLQNTDEKADENCFSICSWGFDHVNFPFESPFSIKKLDCVNKNKQANPLQKTLPKKIDVVIYQFWFLFSRPCKEFPIAVNTNVVMDQLRIPQTTDWINLFSPSRAW